MNDELRILFGIDDSDFSRTALKATGRLLRDNEKMSLGLFHGYAIPNSLLAKLCPDQEKFKVYQNTLNHEANDLLEQARELLLEAGFNERRISVILDTNCKDPALRMLSLAESERFATLALGRWGTASVGRHAIGSATYRVANASERFPVWVVNPRISSRNVLICVIGASTSRPVVDHVSQYFNHLQESQFTLLHIIPPFPVEDGTVLESLQKKPFEEQTAFFISKMEEYSAQAKEIMKYGKERLIEAGIPEENIVQKLQYIKQGIARDILQELEIGNHGILVVGRKGAKSIGQFGLGSKAYKLLCAAHTFIICLVN